MAAPTTKAEIAGKLLLKYKAKLNEKGIKAKIMAEVDELVKKAKLGLKPIAYSEVDGKWDSMAKAGELPMRPGQRDKPKVKSTATTTTATTPAPDDSVEALLFVVNANAIKAAKDELAKLKASPTMQFAIESGGIKQAIARLEKIERRLAKSE